MTIKYVYVDLETTVNGGPEKDSPEAHWLTNKVLLAGCWNEATQCVSIDPNLVQIQQVLVRMISLGHTPCIVAHNAKFDLKYLLRELPHFPWHKVKAWDTMTWEYRVSGQSERMPSLEKVAAKYSIPFSKTLDLGAILASGCQMEDIDQEMLAEYLEGDVEVLKEIHECQLAQGYECDMDYILPLSEMELNGMKVNRPQAQELMKDLCTETHTIEEAFIKHIKQQCEWQDGTPLEEEDFTDQIGTKSKYIKPTASRTLSFLLTGRPSVLQITPKWAVRYRGGMTPYYGGKIPTNFKDESDSLGFSMAEGVLEQDSSWIAREALEHRKANKLLSTYISPMLHTSSVQGTIHPKLNTAITATGRLSSSNPNGQNMPGTSRQLIVSNYSRREIVEADFSQLELVAVASIAGDPHLINDLHSGVDIHYNTASMVFGQDKAEAMRKIAKNVNFGVLYGGKANGLSYQTGVDKDVVQKLIDAFYKKYPGIARWQKRIFNDVVSIMSPHDIKYGEQRYSSMYTEPFSGRRFKFIEQESPKWLRHKTGRKWSFSPQQTSNYPIQGFAGGDIVMFALTELWKDVKESKDEISFIMTVHDSIIMEVHPALDIKTMIDSALSKTKKHFNLPLDLHCDIESGPTWK